MGRGALNHLRRFGRSRLRRAAAALAPAMALAFPLPALAQTSVSDTAEVHATIVDNGAIVKLTDMQFGDIVKPTAPRTITLTPSASASCNAPNLVRTGPCQAASFRGDLSWFYFLRVTKPAGGQIYLTGPNGATMQLNNFTFGGTTGLSLQLSNSTYQYYLVSNIQGVFTFHVGGTLHVAANQRAGVYQGTFALEFNYD